MSSSVSLPAASQSGLRLDCIVKRRDAESTPFWSLMWTVETMSWKATSRPTHVRLHGLTLNNIVA